MPEKRKAALDEAALLLINPNDRLESRYVSIVDHLAVKRHE
jgi:hypothetical protein